MPVESIYACPVPAAMAALPLLDCPASYGHIQAVALQIVQGTASFTNTSIALLATWTPLIASATATGVRVVPATDFATTPGEPITDGGNDQSTFRGRPKLKGVGYTTATYMLDGVTHAFAAAVNTFTKQSAMASQRSRLRAFFLTDDNYIISGIDYQGFEIFNHVVQDVQKGGEFKPYDKYTVTFGMDYGWSLSSAITTKASFDVLSLVQFSS